MKQKIAFTLIMGFINTGIISFSLIYINLGFTDTFLNIWLKSWGVAYLIIIPVIMTIGPKIEKAIDKLYQK